MTIIGRYTKKIHHVEHILILEKDSTFKYIVLHSGISYDTVLGNWHSTSKEVILNSALQKEDLEKGCFLSEISNSDSSIKIVNRKNKGLLFNVVCFKDGKLDTILIDSTSIKIDVVSKYDSLYFHSGGYKTCTVKTPRAIEIKLLPDTYHLLENAVFKIQKNGLVDSNGYFFEKQ